MTEQNDEKLRVILCRPGKLAETIEMEDSIDAMQELVGDMSTQIITTWALFLAYIIFERV